MKGGVNMDFEKYVRNAQHLQRMIPSQAVLDTIAIRNNLVSYSLPHIPSYDWLNQYNNIISRVRPSFLDAIQSYQEIISNIPSYYLNVASTYVSQETSREFTSISAEILNDIDDIDIPEQLLASKNTAIELSNSNKPLTWEQLLAIISVILGIISIIQSQLPDPQITKLENSIQQLMELQTKELNQTNSESIE